MKYNEATDIIADCQGKVREFSVDDKFFHSLITRRFAERSTDSLVKLRGYAEAQVNLELLKANLERLTEEINNEYKHLTETVIPELMEELGIPSIALNDTTSVEVAKKITASMSKANAAAGCAWLEEHGHGSIVKHQVSLNFGVKERAAADKAVAVLKEIGLTPDVAKSVHHSTLSAWAREQLENGEELPMELFGIYQRTHSKLNIK